MQGLFRALQKYQNFLPHSFSKQDKSAFIFFSNLAVQPILWVSNIFLLKKYFRPFVPTLHWSYQLPPPITPNNHWRAPLHCLYPLLHPNIVCGGSCGCQWWVASVVVASCGCQLWLAAGGGVAAVVLRVLLDSVPCLTPSQKMVKKSWFQMT